VPKAEEGFRVHAEQLPALEQDFRHQMAVRSCESAMRFSGRSAALVGRSSRSRLCGC